MILPKKTKLVMIGDSITDTLRAYPIGEGAGHGNGYVKWVMGYLGAQYASHHINVINMGISGNTVRDLKKRWQTDVYDLNPDWLSIMIGINDVWRQFDRTQKPDAAVQPKEFEATYRELLDETLPKVKGIVLMTPFMIENNKNEVMRKRMTQYGAIVKKLAKEYKTVFVDTQAAFDVALKHVYSGMIARDRIHPGPAGHMILANAFLKAIKAK